MCLKRGGGSRCCVNGVSFATWGDISKMKSDSDDSKYLVGERGGGSVTLRRFGMGMGAVGLKGVSRRAAP